MDLQLIIVIIIGIIVGIILLRQVYQFIFTKKDFSHCGGCNMCELPHKKETEEPLSRSHYSTAEAPKTTI